MHNVFNDESARAQIIATVLGKLRAVLNPGKLSTSLFQGSETAMVATAAKMLMPPEFLINIKSVDIPTEQTQRLYGLNNFHLGIATPTELPAHVKEQLARLNFSAAYQSCDPSAITSLHNYLLGLLVRYDTLHQQLDNDCENHLAAQYTKEYVRVTP